MKRLIFPLIFLLSLTSYSQEDEFMATIIGDKEAFLSSKTGEFVFRKHDETDVSNLRTTENGVIYTEIKSHTVVKGETLSAIGKKWGISVSEIKKQNKLSTNNLKIGQTLKIAKYHKVKSSSPVVSQAEGTIIARLAPGQTPNNMTPPDLPPDAMPGSTINLVVEKDTQDTKEEQEEVEKTESVKEETIGAISEDGILIHTVKVGESLFSIAKKYRVSMKDLKEENNLALNMLTVGQKLKVKIHNPAMFNSSNEVLKVEKTEMTPQVGETNENESKQKEILEVKEKDVVEEKAEKVIEIKLEEKSEGEVKKEDAVQKTIDKYLKDPKKKDDSDVENEASNDKESSVYIVEKGDTLWAIANKHKMTVDQLKKLNKLSSNVLSVGQKIKVQ